MNGKETHENLSSFIKNVHKKLKENYTNISRDTQSEKVWEEHCSDTELLSKYACAMHQLATNFWEDSMDGNRITWCHKYIESYFFGGILDKLQLKDQRRSEYNKTENQLIKNVVKPRSVEERIRILDVGSCYNPFKSYEKFCVVALDLCPAIESVLKCDFLKLQVNESLDFQDQHSSNHKSVEIYLENLDGSLESLPQNSFHVVIFSLLLDYLPSSEQRFLSCVKAQHLLARDGILLIVSPDSRKQHRNMLMTRSWRTAIESIGFQRCMYQKLEHLHCMAFRKTSISSPYSLVRGVELAPRSPLSSSMIDLMRVPQDKHQIQPSVKSDDDDDGGDDGDNDDSDNDDDGDDGEENHENHVGH